LDINLFGLDIMHENINPFRREGMYSHCCKSFTPIMDRCDRTDANVMPADNPDDSCEPGSDTSLTDETFIPAGLTLENIIDLTEEFEHLNELVILQIEKEGVITCPESYFNVVPPILDLLEVEIRLRYYHGMSNQEMKLLVQDWIDQEIAVLKK